MYVTVIARFYDINIFLKHLEHGKLFGEDLPR